MMHQSARAEVQQLGVRIAPAEKCISTPRFFCLKKSLGPGLHPARRYRDLSKCLNRYMLGRDNNPDQEIC